MMTILISEGCRHDVSYASLHYCHCSKLLPVALLSMRSYFCLCFLVHRFFAAAFTSFSNRPFFFCRCPSNKSPVSSRNLTLDRARALSLRPFILNSS